MPLGEEDKKQIHDFVDKKVKDVIEGVCKEFDHYLKEREVAIVDSEKKWSPLNPAESFQNFLSHQEDVIYRRTEYFLIAHAFLVAGYAQIVTNKLNRFSFFIAFFGMVLAFLWLLLSFRDWPTQMITRRILDGFDYKPDTLPAKMRQELHPLFHIPAIPTVIIGVPLFVIELWGGMLIRSVYYLYLSGNRILIWILTNQAAVAIFVVGLTVAFVPIFIFYQGRKYNQWAEKILREEGFPFPVEDDSVKRKRKKAKCYWLVIGMILIICAVFLVVLQAKVRN